jgi:hypothetical protein
VNPGVQVSVPDVRSGLATKLAPCPDGSAERFAVKDWIGSPSGSVAVTFTTTATFSVAGTEAGAVTTGAWSVPSDTMIVVELPALSALAAVNDTLQVPVCSTRGVQSSRPPVRVALTRNTASLGAGSPLRSAASAWIGSPSVSATLTASARRPPGATRALGSVVTTGA